MKFFTVVSPNSLALALAVPWLATSCATGECVAPAPGDDNLPPTILETGCVDRANPTEPADGVFRYTVAQTFWSDGAEKDRWFSVPDGTKMTIHEDGRWQLPVGAVTIKHFREEGRLFETRFYVRDAENSFHGYTYEWNEDESDATLVAEGGKQGVDVGGELANWDYPSRGQCNSCHNSSEDFFVGFQTRQLNTGADDPTGTFRGNQIQLLDNAGVVQTQLDSGEVIDGVGGVAFQGAYARGPNSPGWRLEDVVAAGPQELEHEARSYLAVNCAYCHNESNRSHLFNARYDTLLEDSGMCDEALNKDRIEGNLDLRIEPSSPANSRIFQRQSVRGEDQMPNLGSHVPDVEGTQLLAAWIESMAECRDQ